MPRLSLEQHYRRYSLLRLLWLEMSQIYATLAPIEQWELHAFYQPSRQVDFTEFETHVASLKRDRPALVNKVGKHFRKLERTYLSLRARGLSLDDKIAFSKGMAAYLPRGERSATELEAASSGKGRRIVVGGVMRPEINLQQLARALLAIAIEDAQKSGQRRRP